MKLRSTIRERGTTQANLARALGQSPKTVHHWVRRNRVPAWALFEVAYLLGVDARELPRARRREEA